MAPFSTSRLAKAFVLAPITNVTANDITIDGDGQVTGFKQDNYKPERNYVSWGNYYKTPKNQPAKSGLGFFGETHTDVIRFWADWNSIQGEQPYQFPNATLQALDYNIWAARNPPASQVAAHGNDSQKLTVILTTRGFPAWVTGSGMNNSAGTFIPITDGDTLASYSLKFKDDPLQGAAEALFTRANSDRFDRGGGDTSGRPPSYQLRWPGNYADADNANVAKTSKLGPTSDWYRWIQFLAYRYHPDEDVRGKTPPGYPGSPPPARPGTYIDVLEVVNEPNFEIWPQTSQANNAVQIAPKMTAAMLEQADSIRSTVNAGKDDKLYFAGPATSDGWRKVTSENRRVSSYDWFLIRMALELRKRNFFGSTEFIFTHHNYKDVESAREGRAPRKTANATENTNSAAWVLSLMHGRVKLGKKGTVKFAWKGWPSASDPRLALTEGGARDGLGKGTQGAKIEKAFNFVRNDVNKKAGISGTRSRVVLFSNFLTWKDPIILDGDGNPNPTTKSHLIDDVTITGVSATPLPPGMYSPGTPEPSTDEYDQAQERRGSAYRRWTDLKQD